MFARRTLAFGIALLLAFATSNRTARATRPGTARAEPAAAFAPDPASVVRSGPAYRYPQAGWIVLHVEGAPYERGYQHGQLMAAEIVDYMRTLADIKSAEGPVDAWRDMRMLVNALFLRRYDAEYLEEMKGIADGAAAAGAAFDGRKLDLVDIVAVNSAIEVEFLQAGLDAHPTGLEGKAFREPPDVHGSDEADDDHCSAFAAVGPATADGGIVFGHITMFKLPFVRHYNVWLDVKPSEGHRVVMQGYPGAIMSGLDFYMNDAGLLVAETTIKQTTFDTAGQTVASRIRRALQYSDSIDRAVEILSTSNNGLYTNEWLLADIKTNEIAMFELGTRQTRLWRSSKDQWPGGTKGFYWGCNNAKSPAVRAETVASLNDKPANLVLRPSDRDLCWLKLFDKRRGKIDVKFGFEAFTTPPLAAFPSCDAKFTTTALAKELKSWALYGPPLGHTWEPTIEELRRYKHIEPLVSNDWALIGVDAPPSQAPSAVAVDLKPFPAAEHKPFERANPVYPPAWHGTLLPASDADTWLAAAFADYERIVAHEKALGYQAMHAKAGLDDFNRHIQERLELDLFAPRSRWLTAVRRAGRDAPLAGTAFDWRHNEWYDIAAGKGVLLLAALRGEIGDEPFFSFMDNFGRGQAGQRTATAQFRAAAEKAAARSLSEFFDHWLAGDDLPVARGGHFWAIESYEAELDHTLIVYGTKQDVHLQREAADLLKNKIARRWSNQRVPVVADSDVTDEQLKNNHLLLVGRPATNGITARCGETSAVRFGAASFELRGEMFSNSASAVVCAGENPFNARREVVVYAGLSAEATRRAIVEPEARYRPPTEILLFPARCQPRRLCIAAP